jgi:hypothetical protein
VLELCLLGEVEEVVGGDGWRAVDEDERVKLSKLG